MTSSSSDPGRISPHGASRSYRPLEREQAEEELSSTSEYEVFAYRTAISQEPNLGN